MTDSVPRVSVGMPVYNGERYLRESILSVINQTFSDFNIIISDNASTDGTQDICETLAAKDKRIKYYRNEKNLGAAPNYNRVFNLSRSKYFKWADYDDLIAPDFLSKCVEFLDQNPSIVLCYPRAEIIDEEGESLGEHNYIINLDHPEARIRFQKLVLNPATGFEVSGLIRSDQARKTRLHGGFPASDLVFLAELALQGPFYKYPEILFYPRYHSQQSARMIPIERDRVTFFDASYEGRITLPKWQYLDGYLQAIRQAPINQSDKIYCCFQMVRWILMPDHFRALGKDVFFAANRWMARALNENKVKLQNS